MYRKRGRGFNASTREAEHPSCRVLHAYILTLTECSTSEERISSSAAVAAAAPCQPVPPHPPPVCRAAAGDEVQPGS